MKEIIQEEISKLICDATDEELEYGASCCMAFDFGYGSNLDGLRFDLDFSDDVAQDIMDMLCDKYPNVKKIVEDKKKEFGV